MQRCISLTPLLDCRWMWKVENGGRLVFIRNSYSEWNNRKTNSKWDKFIHGGFHSPLLHPCRFLHLHDGAGLETCTSTDIIGWLNSGKFSIIHSEHCLGFDVVCQMIVLHSVNLIDLSSSNKSFFEYHHKSSSILKYHISILKDHVCCSVPTGILGAQWQPLQSRCPVNLNIQSF